MVRTLAAVVACVALGAACGGSPTRLPVDASAGGTVGTGGTGMGIGGTGVDGTGIGGAGTSGTGIGGFGGTGVGGAGVGGTGAGGTGPGIGGTGGAAGGHDAGETVDAPMTSDAAVDGVPPDGNLDAPADVLDAGSSRGCPLPDVADAGAACSTFAVAGPWCPAEKLVATDAGTSFDGGAIEPPEGGVVIDGDYELYRWQTTGGTGRTRRTVHVANGKVEWSFIINSSVSGGVDTAFAFNATFYRSGTNLVFSPATCISGDAVFTGETYGYTARGDDLVLYFGLTSGNPYGHIYTYKRRCTR